MLKVDHINDAYSQLRISGLTIDPTPEDLEIALERLENMAAEWSSRYCFGFNFEDNPDPNTESGIDRKFAQTFATNLAVRLIPDFNKTVPDTLFMQAKQSMSNAAGTLAADRVKGVEYPARMPRGSGTAQKWNRWLRFNSPVLYVANHCDVQHLSVGDVQDYEESYSAYLEGETIASFTIVATTGITLGASSNDDDSVLFRVTADSVSNPTITIVVTTSTGRKAKRVINFEIAE